MKLKNNDKKQIPMKNYLICGIVVLATVLLVIYIRSWYYEYNKAQLKIPVIRGHLNEINYDELKSYVGENPNLVIYACVPSKEACRDLETKLKVNIKKYNLKEKMVYLNLNEANTVTMNNNYGSKEIVIDDIPFVALFKDGKIIDLRKSNSSVDRLSVDDIMAFLEEYEIIVIK